MSTEQCNTMEIAGEIASETRDFYLAGSMWPPGYGPDGYDVPMTTRKDIRVSSTWRDDLPSTVGRWSLPPPSRR